MKLSFKLKNFDNRVFIRREVNYIWNKYLNIKQNKEHEYQNI